VGCPWFEFLHVDSWWQLHHLQREPNELGFRRVGGCDEREKHIETKGKETERQISINYFARFQF